MHVELASGHALRNMFVLTEEKRRRRFMGGEQVCLHVNQVFGIHFEEVATRVITAQYAHDLRVFNAFELQVLDVLQDCFVKVFVGVQEDKHFCGNL